MPTTRWPSRTRARLLRLSLPATRSEGGRKVHNILIVDDAQTDRDILGRIVESSGHQPIYATDGAQALGAAKTARPALILLDVVMPGQDGYKTCRTLKADPQTAKIPVVLVTSKGSD